MGARGFEQRTCLQKAHARTRSACPGRQGHFPTRVTPLPQILTKYLTLLVPPAVLTLTARLPKPIVGTLTLQVVSNDYG